MTRWFVLFLGLSIVAGTLYLVVPKPTETPHVSAGPPGEIDAPSRTRLETVLKEADREPSSR